MHGLILKFGSNLLASTSISQTDLNGVPQVGLKNLPMDVVNALLYFAGGLSVIFIIVGGLRYVLSAGDPKRISQAKDTILYAAIGLAITLTAYAIVNFLLGSL